MNMRNISLQKTLIWFGIPVVFLITLLSMCSSATYAQTPAYEKATRSLRVTDNGQIVRWKDWDSTSVKLVKPWTQSPTSKDGYRSHAISGIEYLFRSTVNGNISEPSIDITTGAWTRTDFTGPIISWQSGANYQLNNRVELMATGEVYLSKINGNTGHQPITGGVSDAYWTYIGLNKGDWYSGGYFQIKDIVTDASDSKRMYISNIENNEQPLSDHGGGSTWQLIGIKPSDVSVPDATTTVKGKIKLAGDLSGTADLPTVPELSLKEILSNKQNSLAVDGTGIKYPTVDAVNNNVVKLTTNQVITGIKSFSSGQIFGDYITNTFIGDGAGVDNAPISDNQGRQITGVGANSLRNNTTGYAIDAFGYNSLYNNITGTRSVGIGYQSLYRTESNSFNTAVGTDAGYRIKSDNNIVIGFHALFGASNPDDVTGSKNYFFGNEIGGVLTTGYDNIVFGHNAAFDITTGYKNTLIGHNTALSITTGYQNVALGEENIQFLTTGTNNVSVGYRAMYNLTGAAYQNTSVGDNSLFNLTSGAANTSIGGSSGLLVTTGNFNAFLGYNAGNDPLQKVDANFSVSIGYGSYNTKSNQVALGHKDNITETLLRGNVLIGTEVNDGVTKLQVTGAATVSLPPTAATGVLRLTDLGTGWAQYIDNAYTSGSPLVINSGATNTIGNNASTSITSQLPIGVTSFYNATTGKITPELNGDSYLINVRFTAVSSSVTGLIDVGVDVGGAMNIVSQETVSLRKGVGNSQRVNIIFDVFSGSTFLANGGLIKLTSIDGNTSIYDVSYKVTRTHKAK